MTDRMDEANQEGVGEYASCGNALVGRQVLRPGCSTSEAYRSTVRRSSSSNYRSNTFISFKLSKLIAIVVQLLCLSSFCRGDVLDYLFGQRSSSCPTLHPGCIKERSMLSSAVNIPSRGCTKFYFAAEGETCATLRQSQSLSQAQIFELNPGLNCLTLHGGQQICVQGISPSCRSTIAVTKGQTSPTCASIEAEGNLTSAGLLVLNPGLSCPEAAGNGNSWPDSQLVCAAAGLGDMFFEYIGASGNPISFGDVQPLLNQYPTVNFHYILAFAIDVDASGNRTNGTFYPYWSDELSPAAVKAFKAANPGVQILMSLGGASKYVNDNLTVTVVWEDPPNNEEWIEIAQNSLTAIASEYFIDGIDIDYETFPNGSSNFAYCIGTLIERLKGNATIGLATIAPYDEVIPEYLNLMTLYGDQVDYVNFQFYSYLLPTVQSYISQFNATAVLFVPWKLLASTEVNGTNSIDGPLFLEALDQIQQTRGLRGVMLYDADHSVPLNFSDEKGILALLSNSSSTGPALPPAVAPSPGSPGAAPSPGGPALPPAVAPSPGSPGAAPSPGGPGAAPSPGSPGAAPSPGGQIPPSPGGPAAPSALSPGGPAPPSTGGAPGNSSNAPAPAPSSAPGRLLRNRMSTQVFGLFTTVFVLLLTLYTR